MLRILHRLAVELAMPGVEREAADAAQLKQMAQQMTPEEVQLYYQIGVSGKRDIMDAPDLRSGFEMVLLRMLAFRPDDAGSHREPAAPRTREMPERKSKGFSRQPSPHRDLEIQQSRPQYGAEVQQPTVQQAAAPAPPSADEWSQIVASLELGGLSRQLAANCALKSIDAQQICLALQESHRALKSEMAEQRLLEALQGRFSSSVSLRIEIGEPAGDTPAQQQALADEQNVVAARAQMAQDPFVKAAVQQLDATLLEETVKPV